MTWRSQATRSPTRRHTNTQSTVVGAGFLRELHRVFWQRFCQILHCFADCFSHVSTQDLRPARCTLSSWMQFPTAVVNQVIYAFLSFPPPVTNQQSSRGTPHSALQLPIGHEYPFHPHPIRSSRLCVVFFSTSRSGTDPHIFNNAGDKLYTT